jgi:hypothetical protein
MIMKKIFLIPLVILLIGCEALEEAERISQDRQQRANLETKCLDGVVYYFTRVYSGYQGYGFMAPKFNADGTLDTCD